MPVYVVTILVPQLLAVSAESADDARTRVLPEVKRVKGVLHAIELHQPDPPPQHPPPTGEAA